MMWLMKNRTVLFFSVGAVLILGVLTKSAFSQSCLRASFEGSVKGGQVFRQPLGNGLVIRFDPLKDKWGWEVVVSPQESTDDWAYPVNPPLRFGNAQYLGTGYGEPVKQKLSYPHEIHFLLTNADYLRMSKLASDALWPYQSRQPDKAAAAYLDALKTVAHGTVILTPIDYDRDAPPEKIEWMKFSAVVIAPQGFQGDTALHWTKGGCDDSTLESGREHPAK